MIRYRIRQVRESQPQFIRCRIHRVRVKRRSDRRKHRALQPSRRFPICSHRRLHVHRGNRMIRIKPDVVLARPYHLYRLSSFLRQHRRFYCKIWKRLPPKRPAQQRYIHCHIFFLRAHRLRDRIARAHRALRRHPCFHFSVAIHRQRRRRLHRSMRQQRRIIFRLYNLSALRKPLVHIPNFPDHFTRLPRRLFQFLAVRPGVKDLVRAFVPFYFQLLPPLHRRPRAVRQYRNAAQRLHIYRRLERGNRLRRLHSADRERLFVIHRLHRAAHHRRMHHRRV